jgi:hypothetical protein
MNRRVGACIQCKLRRGPVSFSRLICWKIMNLFCSVTLEYRAMRARRVRDLSLWVRRFVWDKVSLLLVSTMLVRKASHLTGRVKDQVLTLGVLQIYSTFLTSRVFFNNKIDSKFKANREKCTFIGVIVRNAIRQIFQWEFKFKRSPWMMDSNSSQSQCNLYLNEGTETVFLTGCLINFGSYSRSDPKATNKNKNNHNTSWYKSY